MSLLGLLVLAAAPAAAEAPTELTRPTGQCQVTVVAATRDRGDRSGEWKARDVMDLQFRARLAREVDPEQLEFRVTTPNGHLYRKLRPPRTLPVPDEANELKRRTPRETSTIMPVAGTGIVTRGLYGKWVVTPYLLGSSRPCGRPFTFTLKR